MSNDIYPAFIGLGSSVLPNIEAFFSGRGGERHFMHAGLYMPRQEHTDRVLFVDANTEPGLVADAVVTTTPGLMLGVKTADCVPVLVVDPVRRAVAAIHAGWRGTAGGIIRKTLRLMHVELGSDVDNMYLAIGPSIRGCCYNVGQDVADAVKRAGEGTDETPWITVRQENVFVDLAEANRDQAVLEGVSADRISIQPYCTSCRTDLFYSYRREGQGAGRQGGFIRL